MNDEPAIISLIGLRCSGKTSVGRELARRLRLPFVDLDDEIAKAHAIARRPATIPQAGQVLQAGEVLAAVGEPAFRHLEERALESVLSRTDPCVLATGGGVVERAINRERLARRTRCFWLRVGIPELESRLRADATSRPPLMAPADTGLPSSDPAAELSALAARREPLYAEVAGMALDCRGKRVREVAAEIVSGLGRGSGRGCRA